MAEAIVSLAVERIADLLIREPTFLHGVSKEVERLQAELKRMQCFLKDADLKQQQDERVRNWVAEIRDVAYDAEDVIDTFIIKVACREEGLCRLIKKSVFILTRARNLHNIGTRINSIQSKLKDISDSMQRYGIKFVGAGQEANFASEMQQRLRRTYPHAEEDVVSLEGSTRELMAQLMEEEDRLCIVSIVGMGGLGKTTLAKKAYNHIDLQRHFDCFAWTFVSQQYIAKDVLYAILIKVTSPSKEQREMLEKLREEELVERLYNVLKWKRYLVVLDDIWRSEAWDSLKVALPRGKKGSKVLFTTRNKEVALYADPLSSQIEPPFLTNEESWDLLRRKTFPRDIVGEHGCPPEFETLGREMVRKCGGLPLAIVVLGGLLVTKSLSEWEMVQRDINAHLKKFQQQHRYGGVYAILDLSYHDLPYHLKPCFLHLANFPEDWEIHKRKLIRLWIAEGFVASPLKGEGAETIEELAEQYLGELISRCIVQVGQMDYTGRRVKTCRIHDLMRDLCISKSEDENFLAIIQKQENTTSSHDSSILHLTTAKSRRVAIHSLMYHPNDSSKYVPFAQGYQHIRSLLYFVDKHQTNLMRRRQEIFIYKEFRLLRVLDVDWVNVNGRSKVPSEIGNLIHLRYLGLNSTGLDHLPQSIGNLRSLITLNIGRSDILRLPNALLKLERLRHLILPYRPQFRHFALDTLRNLETLKRVKGEVLIRNDAVLKLTNLRHLQISFEKSEDAEVFLKSPIVSLGRLGSLRMSVSTNSQIQNLESLSHCYQLSKLYLYARIPVHLQRKRNFGFLPASLAKLMLSFSRFQRDPMAVLGKLPNLRILHLGSYSFHGSKMVCSAHGFPQLENLDLFELKELEEWRVEEGAMPSLRRLSMAGMPKLRMMPEGLQSVTTLRELTVYMMKTDFGNRIRVINGIEGDDFDKVRHIPSISINHTKD